MRDVESCFQSCGEGWLESDPYTGSRLKPTTYNVPWVVIGAGFTGIAAARRLATTFPDQTIFLIDAMDIAYGNAGRSSGFVVSLGSFDSRNTRKNKLLYRLGQTGLSEIRQLINQHKISCQWNDTGRLICARSNPALKKLEEVKSVLNSVGSDFRELSTSNIFQLTGMKDLKGVQQVDSAMVRSSQLIRGLVENLPKNVSIFPRTEVQFLSKTNPILLRCGPAEVRAERVILTINGFSPSAGLLRTRVFPVRIFASLARPIPKNAFSDRLPWGSTTAGEVGSSLRLLSCGRILVRNGANYGFPSHNGELKIAAERHRKILKNRFPEIDDWTIESTWSAPIGITANSNFFFGNVQTNLYCVAGFNGHGIALGTALGKLAAISALGQNSPELKEIQSLASPAWVPGQFLTGIGARSWIRLLNHRFRKEM